MILNRQFIFLDEMQNVLQEKIQLFEQLVASFVFLIRNEIVPLGKNITLVYENSYKTNKSEVLLESRSF